MKKITGTCFLLVWLFAHASLSAPKESINIELKHEKSSDSEIISVNAHVNCSPGVIFTMYLYKVNGEESAVNAILGSYAIPMDFPKSGFNFSTMIEIGGILSESKEREFLTQYKSKIDSTEEISVYSVATSSSVRTKSMPKIDEFTSLQTVKGMAFSSVSSVKLATWTVEGIDSEPFSIELWIAYATNISDEEFLKNVYSGTEWILNGPLKTYPIQFFQKE